jgi:hypothetical protein
MEGWMTNPKRTAAEQLDSLLDAYLSDLLELPPEDVLADPGDPSGERKFFQNLVEKARAEAGKRRLAKAKAELGEKALITPTDQPVDIEVARRYIAAAANDKRFTLAARDLREIPDEEVIRLYLQLKHLEAENKKG